MKKAKNKKFDAVDLMRRLRGELNDKLAGMTFEEQRHYLDEHEPTDHRLRRLMACRRAAQQNVGSDLASLG